MRVLHVITGLPVGGAETFLAALTAQLQTHDIENHVIYFRSGPLVHHIKAQGVPVYQVTGCISLYDPLFFKRLYRLTKRIAPDCIHSSLWAANVASRIVAFLLGIPHMSSFHNNLDQDGLIRTFFDRLTQNFSDILVPVSTGVAQSLYARDPWIVPQRVTVIKNGINNYALEQEAKVYPITRKDIGLDTQHYIIGSVGRFVALKNYPLLLESFFDVQSRIPHARLLLMGQGPEEKKLRALTKERGLEDSVLFIIGHKAVPYYSLLDCFVLSSFKEGISIALLEAMSFSRVCIVTSQDGLHDVIQHSYNGLLVPSDDKKSMVHALEWVFNDEPLRVQLGLQAAATVRRDFALEHTTRLYSEVYQDMIDKRAYGS